MNKTITLFLIVFGLSAPSHAASFDCNKASSFSEKEICADEPLSKLDSEMAQAYKSAKAYLADKAQLKKEQRSWLKTRNECINKKCLKYFYDKRIYQLKMSVDEFGQNFSGWNSAKKEIFDYMISQVGEKETYFSTMTLKDEPLCRNIIAAMKDKTLKHIAPVAMAKTYDDPIFDQYKFEGMDFRYGAGGDNMGYNYSTENFSMYEVVGKGNTKEKLVFFGEYKQSKHWRRGAFPLGGERYSFYLKKGFSNISSENVSYSMRHVKYPNRGYTQLVEYEGHIYIYIYKTSKKRFYGIHSFYRIDDSSYNNSTSACIFSF